MGLFKCFKENDATLIEINPVGLTIDNKIKICDQKMNIDDNSAYRQPRLAALEDITQVNRNSLSFHFVSKFKYCLLLFLERLEGN